MDIGLNLAKPSHGLPCAFIDRCQSADQPRLVVGSGTGSINAMGWPVGPGRFAGQYPIDPGTRKYTLIVTQGTVSQIAVPNPKATVKIVDGMATFDITGATPGFSVAMTVTTTGADEARWALVPAELADAWRADPLAFDPDWLAARRGVKVVRFMDWMATNDNVTGAYAPGAVGAFGQFARGMPVELITKLANALDAEPWCPIPVRATDDGVRDFVSSLIKQSKRPPRFELGNEVWNSGFKAFAYAKQQEVALYGITDPQKIAETLGQRWYGYRSAQVSKIIQAMGYKIRKDFRMGLGCQSATPSRASLVWEGVAKAGGVDADFSDWIVTGYIWGTLKEQYDVTLPLVRSGDLDPGYENLLHGETFQRPDPKHPGKMLAPARGLSVDWLKDNLATHAATAKAHGLDLTVYEGNYHLIVLPHFATSNLIANGFTDVTQDQVQAYFAKLQTGPRGGEVFKAILDAAEAAGASTFCIFNDASPSALQGYFGIVGTPAFDVTRAWITAQAPKVDLQSLADAVAAVKATVADLESKIGAALAA